MNELQKRDLEEFAKEIHEKFSQASITHGIINEKDCASYEKLPLNLKNVLLDLAVFIDKNYIRRYK